MLLPRRAYLLAAAAAVFLSASAAGIQADPGVRKSAVDAGADAESVEDDYRGMPPGKGREEVFGLCGTCHSMKLVTQQGLSRSTWEEVLVFMVEEQEMAELEPEDEKLVLDYLERFYGPDRLARRMARQPP